MKIEVNITKKRFFVLLFAILLLGIIGVVYAFGTNNPSKFGHSVGEIDWDQEIPDSIKVRGLVTVNGQQVLYSDDGAITVGDLVGGDGTRNLILRANDKPQVIINSLDRVGIGILDPTKKVDVDGEIAANDVWLKNANRWASETGISLYNCPGRGSEPVCSSNPTSTCGGIGTSSTCYYYISVGGAACNRVNKDCTYLGKLLK